MKRGRNQRRRPGGGSNPNRALDSNGPDVRIRGTANQIYDKYQALARDASSSGDRVKAESYLQHAEHYYRVIRAMQPAQMPNQPNSDSDGDNDGDQPGFDDGDADQPQQHHREARPQPQRDRRNGHTSPAVETVSRDNNGDDASIRDEPAGEDEPKAAAPSNGDEEKKPRRRRAPRRTTKKDDDDAESETPAAAE